MRIVIIYRVLPEAVTEVKKPMSVAHILLLSDSYQVVSEYPDLPASASPQDYDAGDVVNIAFEPEGEVFQLKPSE